MFSGVGLTLKRLSSRPNPHHWGLSRKQWWHSQMPVAIVPDTTLPMEILHKQKWKRLKATHTKMEHLSRKKRKLRWNNINVLTLKNKRYKKISNDKMCSKPSSWITDYVPSSGTNVCVYTTWRRRSWFFPSAGYRSLSNIPPLPPSVASNHIMKPFLCWRGIQNNREVSGIGIRANLTRLEMLYVIYMYSM